MELLPGSGLKSGMGQALLFFKTPREHYLDGEVNQSLT
jgi:hypothetical protein